MTVKDIIERVGIQFLEGYSKTQVYAKKFDTIKLLTIPASVKMFTGVILNALMHGSTTDVRIHSVHCFKYFIEFSTPEAIKTEIIKICGALIRVGTDKFPSPLKL